MTENPRPVIDKVLAFKMEEVLDKLQTAATKKGWVLAGDKRTETGCRLTVSLPETSAEFTFEVCRLEPRTISGSFRIPQTHLSVWPGEGAEESVEEVAGALHIAFLRAGG